MVSSIGATSMPWRARTFRSYLRFWPIFRTASVLQHRLQRASASSQRDLALESARRPAGRHRRTCGSAGCSRPARRGGQRDADKLRLHGIERGGLGVDGDTARSQSPSSTQRVQRRRHRARSRRRRWSMAHVRQVSGGAAVFSGASVSPGSAAPASDPARAPCPPGPQHPPPRSPAPAGGLRRRAVGERA
jgi:hypothetical protein